MSIGIKPLLNYEKLDAISQKYASEYQSASPFPHIALDDFIDSGLVQQLIKKFPALKEKPGQTPEAVMTDTGKHPQPNKLWLSNQIGVAPIFRQLYWELNSAPFINFLENLTGIKNLLPDPHMAGGGVHEIKRDGLLMVHADFNKHPQFQLDRRLNILLYLNPSWDEQWGGHLELWATDMSRCEKRITPTGGRCVIFSTTRNSFHGHPHPLTCPDEQSRKSIALYYYTHGRPAGEDATPHKTLWQDISKMHEAL